MSTGDGEPGSRATPVRLRASVGWFKSSFSNPDRECVEVKFDEHHVHVRDSKYRRDPANDPAREPIITVPAEAWPGFLAEVVGDAPQGSNPALCISHRTDGGVDLSAGGSTVLSYTPAEWAAFVAGAVVGELSQLGVATVT